MIGVGEGDGDGDGDGDGEAVAIGESCAKEEKLARANGQELLGKDSPTKNKKHKNVAIAASL